jgi:hypothetical protein
MVKADEKFDWNGKNDDIVVQSQSAIAIYENPRREVVIRVQRSWDEEEDSFVIISRSNVQSVIEAIKALIGGES